MDERQATDAATTHAEHEGWNLGDYEEPTASLDAGFWTVDFAGREPRPGNHFLVLVNDATGETELVPGR
jgi:hypothetical protein